MTKIDIVSGFLGAGKTTLIKKLIKDALAGSRVVLIENEFGEIGIDGGFLKEAGIEIREMNSGCICCSLVGDFGTSLREVMNQYAPDRILIEPSGVGKLSDVMKAVQDAAEGSDMALNSAVAVVDASKCKLYMKNFGEFFINQVECAGTIILTRTDKASDARIAECVEILREHNPKATIIVTINTEGKGNISYAEGEVTPEKAEIVRESDAIFREEIAAAGLDKHVNQYFTVLTGIQSVGVMGDERTYDYTIALRAVTTDDFMTADWARLPYDLIARVSARIVNEVPHASRVVMDVTTKPPASIEWE